MGNKIGEIEDLILTELNKAPLNVYCKSFERYDGQFSGDDLERFKGAFPACFVSWIGDRYLEVTNMQTYQTDMILSVIVAAASLRGKFDADTKSTGAYQMLEDVKTLLHKNNLGQSEYVGLALVRRVPLVRTPTLAVYGMDFNLNFIE